MGAGTVGVRAPRVHDRREGEKFTSRILPPYMRRGPKVAEVLPILYLRGLSTGDFQEALPVLLGEEAAGLSPANISRLLGVWGGRSTKRSAPGISRRWTTSTSGPTGCT